MCGRVYMSVCIHMYVCVQTGDGGETTDTLATGGSRNVGTEATTMLRLVTGIGLLFEATKITMATI